MYVCACKMRSGTLLRLLLTSLVRQWYVCLHARVFMCVCVCMYVCMRVYSCVCVCVRMFIQDDVPDLAAVTLGLLGKSNGTYETT